MTLTLSHTTASAFGDIGFILGNVNNPDSERRSLPLDISIYSPSGVLIDQAINSRKFTVKTVSDNLNSVSLFNSNQTVGGYGKLTVTIIPTHEVATNGDIVMTFPKWDALSADDEQVQSYFKDKQCTLSNAPQAGGQSISTILSGATCSIDTSYQSIDKVRITNALQDGMNAGEEIIFVLGDVRNPGSLKGVDSIELETQKTTD